MDPPPPSPIDSPSELPSGPYMIRIYASLTRRSNLHTSSQGTWNAPMDTLLRIIFQLADGFILKQNAEWWPPIPAEHSDSRDSTDSFAQPVERHTPWCPSFMVVSIDNRGSDRFKNYAHRLVAMQPQAAPDPPIMLVAGGAYACNAHNSRLPAGPGRQWPSYTNR
ncbi:hypothetical protein RhiJN_25406 [Ceratobasidium sp. AG-Ba]|nr:hypothetical protein RhiJN_25406 [Ceratobasidium sp. AG-Ba]